MRKFSCPAEFVDMQGIRRMQLGYLHPWQLDFDAEDVKEVEVSPIRDITGFYTLLATGMYHGQISGCNDIAAGLIKHQTKNRPQLRKAIDLLEQSIALFNPKIENAHAHVPFLDMTKSEVIQLGTDLGVPFEETWSCTSISGALMQCGQCHQCKSRRKAFKTAGVDDPTKYSNYD